MLRYALRYYISAPKREALAEQTLAALAHDPDLVLEIPIEKAVASTMHQIFLSSTAHDAMQSTSLMSDIKLVDVKQKRPSHRFGN
ncbi:hypothetical protein ASF29_09025 [Rhizobium sp. Leaf262]|nr:hypothetical protein ASF29_09025 [Rhizobium sp. Leaf262]